MTDELKPCPFCGSPGQVKQTGSNKFPEDRRWGVGCCNPMCSVSPFVWGFFTEEEACKEWNKRAGEKK